jgi:hypothetical protein
MAWERHVLGPAKLPQKCVRCGVVLVDSKKNDDLGTLIADPLDREGEACFRQVEEGGRVTIALTIPPYEVATECKKVA